MTSPLTPGRYVRPRDLDERATPLRRAAWLVEAFLWDCVYWGPMKALSIETASNVGAAFLRSVGPLATAHRTAVRNIRLAFPSLTQTEVLRIARGAWETLGRTAGEMPHLARMKPYDAESRIEVIHPERLDEVQESGRPVVLIGGHMANWEVMASAICNRPLDCQITYRAANNPYIDRRINSARRAYGVQILTPKGAGARELVRALSRGQSVALMNDQKFNQGVAVPFFGHDAMTAPGPTRLAMKFNTQLMPVSVFRTGVARYRVTFHEPFAPEERATEEESIVATLTRINRFIEDQIRAAPEQWFWMHNRWPKEAWAAAGVL